MHAQARETQERGTQAQAHEGRERGAQKPEHGAAGAPRPASAPADGHAPPQETDGNRQAGGRETRAQEREREAAAQAAERFAAEHYDAVFRYCLRHAASKEDAQDLTQEVFLRVVRSAAPYEERGKPLAYLYTVARHVCADFHRTRRAAWVEIGEDVPDPAGQRGTDAIDLADLIARLEADEREVVALRYDQGLSVADIAQIMGVSRFAVHRTTKRALAKLERMMQG